ncbi:hypothetical protein HNP84_009616 [Thermocatellispora tengchongensis]|uniref:Uncharacterized protein n=1 Tax=Thermocatellispora tengchongensis TaxID=1073253 RepID=A0A840PL87_9ACTN|nr:hypothetical protein [Thermocatellispora tengchongensis]MBB5139852.1 hypothetical protein [Thermocatellispora tengchongensis]
MILTAAGVVVLLAAAASGLYVLLVQPGRKLSQIAEKFGQFWDDWNGVEDRPGMPGRPGVIVRLESIEEQLRPTHGTSLRDAVNRTESVSAGWAPKDIMQAADKVASAFQTSTQLAVLEPVTR